MEFGRQHNHIGNKQVLAMAVIVAIAMCVLSLIYHPVEISPIQYGICLPSPDSWEFNNVWSGIINIVLIGIICLLLHLINRSYNFVRTTEPAMEAVFLVMAASSPWFTQTLNTSVLLCLANVVCLGIIFASYDTRNATQQMFTIGVVIGIGSMFQYAFLPMACVYFLWSLFMKVMRVKETLAFLAGIVCPYWIALGIGWVKLSSLHFPSITPLFSIGHDHSEFILMLAAIAFAAGSGFLLALVNTVKLYAGNSKVNAMNLCVSTLGAVAVVCILVDFDNMPAYVTTLYLATAVQYGNVCAIWNPRYPWIVSLIPSLAYIAIFVCSVVF